MTHNAEHLEVLDLAVLVVTIDMVNIEKHDVLIELATFTHSAEHMQCQHSVIHNVGSVPPRG